MNEQRKVVFEQRIDFMRAESVNDTRDMRHQIVDDLVLMCRRKPIPISGMKGGLEEIGEIYNSTFRFPTG